jgi:hypothetical protein
LLPNRLFEIEKASIANRTAHKENRGSDLVSSILGNVLLLFVNNLIAKSGAYLCYYPPFSLPLCY